jgi:hypothetical protein
VSQFTHTHTLTQPYTTASSNCSAIVAACWNTLNLRDGLLQLKFPSSCSLRRVFPSYSLHAEVPCQNASCIFTKSDHPSLLGVAYPLASPWPAILNVQLASAHYILLRLTVNLQPMDFPSGPGNLAFESACSRRFLPLTSCKTRRPLHRLCQCFHSLALALGDACLPFPLLRITRGPGAHREGALS